MNSVVLIFSDTEKMSEFITREAVSNVEANSREGTLVGILSDKQVKTAVEKFDAFVKHSNSSKHFSN